MRRLVSKAIDILRKEGPKSLLHSTHWYFTASRVYPPFNKYPELLGKYLTLRSHIQPSRFTDADPFKVLWINPDRIDKAVRGQGIPLSFGRVVDGDWDESTVPFDKRPVSKAIHKRITEDAPWSETELYQQLYQRKKGGYLAEIRPTEDIERRLNHLDELSIQMQQDGYRTQVELLQENPHKTWNETEQTRTRLHPELNEIGVNIGRDGTFYWRHRGQHRLAIARSLNLESVAVQILTRHEKWQNVRDQIRDIEDITELQLSESKITHPDIQDII